MMLLQYSFVTRLSVLVVGASILVGNISLAQAQDDDCFAFSPFPNLDIERLYNKKWYVQEILFRKPEDIAQPSYTCLMQLLSDFQGSGPDLSTFIEQYTATGSNKAVHNSSYAMPVGSGQNAAVWYITSNINLVEYTALWTSTDYESHGVMQWCPYPGSPGGVAHPSERVLIFTGDPNPADEALLDQLRGNLSALGYPTEYATRISHTVDCDYELCQSPTESCCDPSLVNVPPFPNLNTDLLLRKVWYVQEIYFREPQEADFQAPSCFTQVLTVVLDDIYSFTETYINAASGNKTTNIHRPFADGDEAVWELFHQFTLNKHTTVWTSTDYETYGVMHWCPYSENVDPSFERILTFTGSPNPDESLLAELKGHVVSLGFPTENVFQVAHDGCQL